MSVLEYSGESLKIWSPKHTEAQDAKTSTICNERSIKNIMHLWHKNVGLQRNIVIGSAKLKKNFEIEKKTLWRQKLKEHRSLARTDHSRSVHDRLTPRSFCSSEMSARYFMTSTKVVGNIPRRDGSFSMKPSYKYDKQHTLGSKAKKRKMCWTRARVVFGDEVKLTHHSSSSSRITTMTSPSWNDSSSSLSASQSYNARQRVP